MFSKSPLVGLCLFIALIVDKHCSGTLGRTDVSVSLQNVLLKGTRVLPAHPVSLFILSGAPAEAVFQKLSMLPQRVG